MVLTDVNDSGGLIQNGQIVTNWQNLMLILREEMTPS